MRIKVLDESSSGGNYVLSARDLRCRQDADCGCQDQVCTGEAEVPGECVPALFGDGDQATALDVGQRMYGEISSSSDVDTYVVQLPAGDFSITTSGYCGDTNTDTELSVYDDAGALVATDSDSGVAFFAAISSLTVQSGGSYRVEVSGFSLGTGPYIIQVFAVE